MPRKPLDLIEEILQKHTKGLLFDLQTSLAVLPVTVCDCGKPVVFISPDKKFRCSRCGLKWQLCVEVKKILPQKKTLKD